MKPLFMQDRISMRGETMESDHGTIKFITDLYHAQEYERMSEFHGEAIVDGEEEVEVRVDVFFDSIGNPRITAFA